MNVSMLSLLEKQQQVNFSLLLNERVVKNKKLSEQLITIQQHKEILAKFV